MYASVEGASTFPDGPVVRLPENKTLQFPLQLFNHPLYRKAYDAAKQKLLQQYPTGELALPSCPQLPCESHSIVQIKQELISLGNTLHSLF